MSRHLPGPSLPRRPGDVVLGPFVETARQEVRGLAEASLLGEVSVARAAAVLVETVREPSAPLRTLLAGLDALRRAQPEGELAPLLTRSWGDPREAERALAAFALGLPAEDDAEVARMCFGPKIWFSVNGVAVDWRSFGSRPAPATPRSIPIQDHGRPADRRRDLGARAVDALRDAGLTADEVGRVQLGDLGRLIPGGVLVPDVMADPLCVRILAGPGRPTQLAFLSPSGRIAVLSLVLTRYGQDAACRHGRELVMSLTDDLDAGAGRR
jgi:hypothetical protein